jgi:HEPN domain-containing protein
MGEKMAVKWLKQALHDLEMAEKSISIGGYDVAAFLAHQSVEKLLKAILASQRRKVPKTHYVDELAKELGLRSEIIDLVTELTPDYTLSRYPDVAERVPFEEYDEGIAREKVGIAKRIFDSLKKNHRALLVENNE